MQAEAAPPPLYACDRCGEVAAPGPAEVGAAACRRCHWRVFVKCGNGVPILYGTD